MKLTEIPRVTSPGEVLKILIKAVELSRDLLSLRFRQATNIYLGRRLLKEEDALSKGRVHVFIS